MKNLLKPVESLITYHLVINDGGTLHREYALGRKRVDLFVTWKNFKYIVELKINYDADTLK